MKKLILICALFVCIVTLVGCDNNMDKDPFIKDQPNEFNEQEQLQEQNKEDSQIQEKEIKTKKIDSVKKIGDVEITDIAIKLIEKRRCEVTANVKNTSDNFIEAMNTEIKVLNEDGEVMEIFGGMLPALAPREARVFTTYILKDVTDAQDIEFLEAK